ncbi:transcriptional regulator [Leptospira wolffii]|uniref:Transcriptional regulator n=1 Tax=Leptospira wolffii TaxID=409998 RepID=A0A2M9ZBM5_9LEPT|nr:helix-turn-helix transcriptional regulator [Leptospira wolffii]PJZ65830.1 transcriptional regulator [Leptospira wolffii]
MKYHRKQHKNFLKLLKEARLEAGLSQTEVADSIGRCQSFVSRIESGELRLKLEDFLKLYQLYGKPATHFFRAFTEEAE